MTADADPSYAPPSMPFHHSPRWRWVQVLLLGVCALSWLTDAGWDVLEYVLGLAAAYLAIRATRLAVIADADQLIVRNVFRTVQISWQDIARFEPPPPPPGALRNGLKIHLTNGRVVSASAYAPTSWDHGRPGEIAVLQLELLRRQLTGYRAPDGQPPEPAPDDTTPPRR